MTSTAVVSEQDWQVGPPPTVAQLRHRAEIPMLVLGVVLTVVVAALALAVLGAGFDCVRGRRGCSWDSWRR